MQMSSVSTPTAISGPSGRDRLAIGESPRWDLSRPIVDRPIVDKGRAQWRGTNRWHWRLVILEPSAVGSVHRAGEEKTAMTKGLLFGLALAVGSLAACTHQDNPRGAAVSSAATYYSPSAASWAYYSPSAASWAPEVGAWQPPRRAPTSNVTTRGP